MLPFACAPAVPPARRASAAGLGNSVERELRPQRPGVVRWGISSHLAPQSFRKRAAVARRRGTREGYSEPAIGRRKLTVAPNAQEMRGPPLQWWRKYHTRSWRRVVTRSFPHHGGGRRLPTDSEEFGRRLMSKLDAVVRHESVRIRAHAGATAGLLAKDTHAQLKSNRKQMERLSAQVDEGKAHTWHVRLQAASGAAADLSADRSAECPLAA